MSSIYRARRASWRATACCSAGRRASCVWRLIRSGPSCAPQCRSKSSRRRCHAILASRCVLSSSRSQAMRYRRYARMSAHRWRSSMRRARRSRAIRECKRCANALVRRCCRIRFVPSNDNEERAYMKGNMGNFIKQAQQIKENVEKAQAQVASIEVTGEAGGGMVKVTMSGRHEVKRVQIEPTIASDDRELLEDLIAAAVNDAVHRVETATQEKMAGAMAGMQLPPGMKLPF